MVLKILSQTPRASWTHLSAKRRKGALCRTGPATGQQPALTRPQSAHGRAGVQCPAPHGPGPILVGKGGRLGRGLKEAPSIQRPPPSGDVRPQRRAAHGHARLPGRSFSAGGGGGVFQNCRFATRPRVGHMFNLVGGDGRLVGMGGWRLVGMGGWRLVGMGGWRLVGMGGWRLVGMGGWRLVGMGGWQLVGMGGWRLAVGGDGRLAVGGDGRYGRLAAVGGWRSLGLVGGPQPKQNIRCPRDRPAGWGWVLGTAPGGWGRCWCPAVPIPSHAQQAPQGPGIPPPPHTHTRVPGQGQLLVGGLHLFGGAGGGEAHDFVVVCHGVLGPEREGEGGRSVGGRGASSAQA